MARPLRIEFAGAHYHLTARGAWREFVTAGRASPSPWEKLRHQIYLGDDEFIARVTPPEAGPEQNEVPRAQHRALTEHLA